MASSEMKDDEQYQRRMKGQRDSSSAVSVQLQLATPEEEKRLIEAIDLLLAEWVRRRLNLGEKPVCSVIKNG
jgi:hypothetical protein